MVDAASEWILAAGASSPWFAWVHLFDAHAPYDAPAEYQQGRAPYHAEVAYADAMLGRLLDRLRSANVFDRTLIVMTADHGESLGDHGETTQGLFAYDSTLAVPLIVHGPAVAHAVVDAPVGHADLLPTVCDLLGIAPPADLDGQSLLHPPDAERAVYFEALDASLTRGWAPLTGVATGRRKFIDLPLPELYDLAADPNESHNLADRETARKESLARVRAQMATRANTQGASKTAPALDADAVRRLRSLGYAAAPVRAADIAAANKAAHADADDPKRLVALNERFNAALEAFDAGRHAEALAAFRTLLDERPDFITARTSAATVLLTIGRAREAVDLLRAAPAAQATTPDLQAKLGAALREAGDAAGAAAAFERAMASGDQNPERFNDLGVVYARLGRVDEARAAFRELLRRDANAAAVWNNLGVLELSARRRPAATRFGDPRAATRGRDSAPRSSSVIVRPLSRPGAAPSSFSRATTISCSTSACCSPKVRVRPMHCRTSSGSSGKRRGAATLPISLRSRR